MRIRNVEIGRAQCGWVCDVTFTETTASQFTDAEFSVRSGNRWFMLAMLAGYLSAKKLAANLRATKAERAAKGWI